MAKHTWLPVVTGTCLLGAACADTPTKGTVTITTHIDFRSQPDNGTFEVTEGADVLGCSRGSFVDTPTASTIHKEVTCETGGKSGTFTAEFTPQDIPGPGDQNGPWSIVGGTEDFSGLSGDGDFWVVYDEGKSSGVETLTGVIEFNR